MNRLQPEQIRQVRSKSASNYAKSSLRKHLDRFAPDGISTSGVDDINDAYRHYMAAAEFARTIGPDLTFTLGDLNELWNSGYSPESTAMDYANNDAGIKAGATSGSAFESVLRFATDVARNKVRVIDPQTGRIRESTIRDLPHGRTGTPLEDRYRPDRNSGPDDMRGGGSGTMDA